MRGARVATMLLSAAALWSCDVKTPPPPASTATQAAASSSPTTGTPHGDHSPHHGGIVMMKGDLHYEVVVDPTGKEHRIYFTDAVRDDLPASIASDVTLTIHRAPKTDERIYLAIDDSGESWVGHSEPVPSARDATVGVTFTFQGEPYSIELPLPGDENRTQRPQSSQR